MKARTLLANLLKAAVLILVIFLYVVLILFPIVKDINRQKREIKDLHLKIEDSKILEERIAFPDEEERRFFLAADREWKEKVPGIKKGEELLPVETRVSRYIRDLAEAHGVTIENLSPIPTLPEDRSPADPGGEDRSRFFPGGLDSRHLLLSFRGDWERTLHFVNHIPRGDTYLGLAELAVSQAGGEGNPLFTARLECYYLEGNEEGENGRERDRATPFIDLNSPLLLQRVYRNLPGKYEKKELPPRFGPPIFVKKAD